MHEYHGYGSVGVHKELNGTKVLFQKPKASTSLDETHASLVLSQKVFSQPTITYRSKVVQQLRKPAANPWETAWVVWNYTHDHRFYYFAYKTNVGIGTFAIAGGIAFIIALLTVSIRSMRAAVVNPVKSLRSE